MEFTAQSVWEMTKLFVRDPAEASRRILALGLPVNVSVLMLVLAGVMSGVMAAVSVAIYGTQEITMMSPDGTEMVVRQAPPYVIGLFSVMAGLGFSYLVHWVGARSGGTGTLPEVLSVMASLQIALTVLGVGAVIVGIALPLIGTFLSLFVLYVSLRGIGHGVRESHHLGGMGSAIMVIIAAIVLLFFALLILTALFGSMLLGDVTNGL